MSRYVAQAVKRAVYKSANGRCEYCKLPEIISGIPLSIDHIIPVSKGGTNEFDNLCYACRCCNEFKGGQTTYRSQHADADKLIPLFHPRQQMWHDHFVWDEQGTLMIPQTEIGIATISQLQLNRDTIVETRSHWVRHGWHPPKDRVLR